MYAENQDLRAQLEQARQFTGSKTVYDIPPDRMEAIAMALVSAQTEAQRIVNTAREKAWQIITDAQKGLPMAEEPEAMALPMNSVEPEPPVAPEPQKPEPPVAPEPQEPAAPAPERATDDIDAWIESMLRKYRTGGD